MPGACGRRRRSPEVPPTRSPLPTCPTTPPGSLKGVGVPVKLLHEATGHICTVRGQPARGGEGSGAGGPAGEGRPNVLRSETHHWRPHTLHAPRPHQVELKTGEVYRGELHDAEDNWNIQLTNVTGARAMQWRQRAAGGGRRGGWGVPAGGGWVGSTLQHQQAAAAAATAALCTPPAPSLDPHPTNTPPHTHTHVPGCSHHAGRQGRAPGAHLCARLTHQVCGGA